MSSRDIITFNVGGTRYDVSKSLLDQYPDSMLVRLVSDRWQSTCHTAGTTEIFIDGDGKLFRYILRFLRYGVVQISNTEKQNLLVDLDYYGIAYDAYGDINPQIVRRPAVVVVPSVVPNARKETRNGWGTIFQLQPQSQPDSWKCPRCYLWNVATVYRCPSCEVNKPDNA